MIKIDNLVKSYGDFRLELSMELPKGRVSGLVGRNGSGKSTTIKAILGLIQPDSGDVSVFGTEAMHLTQEEKKLIGAAMAESGFSGYLTVNDIIRILSAMYEQFNADIFRKTCADYKLPLNSQLKSFSTGMKARLKTLIACSHEAKLLILDEPTAGLDVVARREVLDMLRDYLAEDPERSMLISSHISSDLEGICDDIYMIHDGKIILHEDTDVILGDYAVMKLTRPVFDRIDRQYILRTKEESFGYSCFTDHKKYYAENWPEIVIESGSIDDLIIMMTERRN